MSRGEKIGGVVLGLLLFAGIFYLLYDSFLSAPPAYEETFAAEDLEEPIDIGDEAADEFAEPNPTSPAETPGAEGTSQEKPAEPAPK